MRADNVLLPKRIMVELGGGSKKWPGLSMVLEVLDGRPQCRELTIRSVEGGREVQDADLSKAKIAQWSEDAFALFALLLADQTGTVTKWVPVVTASDVGEAAATVHGARRSRRIDEPFLREVAAVYLAHRSGKPTMAIAERYGVAHRTAASWAKHAADAGLLPAATRGRRRR